MAYQLPQQLYTAEHVRQLDRIAIDELKIPGYDLMQRAASFSYGCLKQHWPEARSILVICGGGNNAGDGYVLARYAVDEGKQVQVGWLLDPETLTGDAKTAYQDLLAAGCQPAPFDAFMLNAADVVVDALFGTGLDRDIEGKFADAVDAINDSMLPVLAIDIPSGLHANSGRVMGTAVKSDVTPSFIGLKQGMFTNNGEEFSGKVMFNDLEVPDEVYQRLGSHDVSRLVLAQQLHLLPPRQRNAHKGHFGHVLIIGGDRGYLGAAQMAAEAAARVGAGLVSVATHSAHAGLLSVMRPEIMTHGVESVIDLMPLLKRASVIAIGPGLGQSEWAQSLLARVLETDLPLVIDADGLNLLAQDQACSSRWVLTPHPGEAARLLGTNTKTVQADRYAAARQLHEKFKGPVVLKGNGSIIADRDGQLFVCDAGNPGMASGGMGDVLTGIIAGLLAQRLDIDAATKLGVSLHAAAADAAAGLEGERGLLAKDLFPHLRRLVNP